MNRGLLFNLWGSYAIDKVVPRLDLVYFMGGRSKVSQINNNDGLHTRTADGWERRTGFVTDPKRKEQEQDRSVFSARPSVRINLDGKTYLEIGDIIYFDSGNWDGAYKDSGDPDKNSRLTNVFYVDVKWSF